MPAMPPSRVRATTEDEYVLYKGERSQIRLISSAVLEAGLLDGSRSWGADAVRACALGYGSAGGPKDWVERDTNMHIENTVAAVLRHTAPDTTSTLAESTAATHPWLQESLWMRR